MIGRGVLAAVLALGMLLEIAVTAGAHPPVLVGLAVLAADAGVCVAAVLRRRSPGLAAAGATGLWLVASLVEVRRGPAPIACLAWLIVIGAAVRRLPVWAAVLAGGGGVLPVMVARELYTSTVALVLTAGWVVAVGAGGWLRVADGRRRALRESVRRAERVALARDLHDVAAHHLTALIIQAQVAQVGPRGEMGATLGEIEAAGVEALDSLRRVVRLLRDEEDEPEAPGTVADVVAAANGGPRIEVRLELPDGPQPATWPPAIATALYRITQESLTNVARHARDAHHATVTLAHDARLIRLTVTDDGRAGNEADATGHGIPGMRERALALGGTLTAGPSPSGWTVQAALPVPRTP